MRTLKYILLVCVILTISSCGTTRRFTLTNTDLPPISRKNLCKKIKDSSLYYTAIKLKRVKISVNEAGKSSTYRGSIRIVKDSSIWISINLLLGREGARFLLTKDSVHFIDRYHKEFFKGGYEYLSNKLGVQINYKLIQSFLTSEFVNYERDIQNLTNLFFNISKVSSHNGLYALLSYSDKKLARKRKKVERKLRKNKDVTQYYQFSYINPQTFKTDQVFIEEMSGKWKINLKYSDHSRFSGKLFHKKVDFNLEKKKSNIEFSIKYSGVQFKNKLSLPFKIPSHYKSIN